MQRTQRVLNVVRGIEPWTVLKTFEIRPNGDERYLHYPYYHGDPIFPTADDLIMGFKSHSKDMAALQEWATFMLVYDEFTDFEAIQNDPRGEEVIDYLWQASFREFDVPPLKQFLEKCREEKNLEETKA
jgi:hypothetical protein